MKILLYIKNNEWNYRYIFLKLFKILIIIEINY